LASRPGYFRIGASLGLIILICVLGTACKPQYKNLTAVQLRQLAPFKARVDHVTIQEYPKEYGSKGVVAVVWLKTVDRQRVAIGGRDPSREMLDFLQSFKAGQSYTFPQVLLDYEERSGTTLK
jgi:hypothetical protein